MVGVIWYRFVRCGGADWSDTLVPIRPLQWYRFADIIIPIEQAMRRVAQMPGKGYICLANQVPLKAWLSGMILKL